jgi:hypothetical protein
MKTLIWKYLGAMFMEPKGPNGEQAVSFTRFLGFILFIACLCIWVAGTFTAEPLTIADGMLYTLWGLIGIKGAKDVAIGLRREGKP